MNIHEGEGLRAYGYLLGKIWYILSYNQPSDIWKGNVLQEPVNWFCHSGWSMKIGSVIVGGALHEYS